MHSAKKRSSERFFHVPRAIGAISDKYCRAFSEGGRLDTFFVVCLISGTGSFLFAISGGHPMKIFKEMVVIKSNIRTGMAAKLVGVGFLIR